MTNRNQKDQGIWKSRKIKHQKSQKCDKKRGILKPKIITLAPIPQDNVLKREMAIKTTPFPHVKTVSKEICETINIMQVIRKHIHFIKHRYQRFINDTRY